MKKYMLDLILKENRTLSSQYNLLILTSNEKMPEILPGQFAEVRVDGSPTTFLRRPISIHYVDYELNELWLLIQIKGDGTKRLATMAAGESLNLLFPLGNSFNKPANEKANVLLVGGGCGVAPLLYLGSYLKKSGYKVNFLLGARSESDLIELCEYERFGNVYTTTEDGSHGERGFVTQHSVLNNPDFDYFYTCGPTPMMKAVARHALKTKATCEV